MVETWVAAAFAFMGLEHDTKATAWNFRPHGRTVRKKANASDFQRKPPKVVGNRVLVIVPQKVLDFTK